MQFWCCKKGFNLLLYLIALRNLLLSPVKSYQTQNDFSCIRTFRIICKIVLATLTKTSMIYQSLVSNFCAKYKASIWMVILNHKGGDRYSKQQTILCYTKNTKTISCKSRKVNRIKKLNRQWYHKIHYFIQNRDYHKAKQLHIQHASSLVQVVNIKPCASYCVVNKTMCYAMKISQYSEYKHQHALLYDDLMQQTESLGLQVLNTLVIRANKKKIKN